jgi:hypothetical protein
VALQAGGFADRDLRIYTSQQILADHERCLAQPSLARRVVGVTVDPDIKRYLDRAREGCAALWVHVPDDADAKRAVRLLADHPVLHIRHYGQHRQQDLHLVSRANQQPSVLMGRPAPAALATGAVRIVAYSAFTPLTRSQTPKPKPRTT